MSARVASFEAVAKHVYTEPKFVARIEWGRDHPSLAAQLMGQVGRGALEQYVATGKHANPDQQIVFVKYDEPDWDWWEPRYDQPWRRQVARDREFDEKHSVR